MTGQGVGEASRDGVRVVVEVRSVNHRFLDLRVRTSPELVDHTGALEDAVRKQLGRGRIDIGARVESSTPSGATLDEERARAAVAQLRRLRDELAPSDPVPLSLLASVPGLFVVRGIDPDMLRALALEAAERAGVAVIAMRAQEGAALERDFLERLSLLRVHIDAIEVEAPRVVEAARRRLRERVAKALGEVEAQRLEPSRLEQEIVLLADRSDIAEELTRFRSHLDQFRRALASDVEGLGKRLEFLLQELGRETNTLGQKSSDAEIARRVVDMKTELERLREQVQNVL